MTRIFFSIVCIHICTNLSAQGITLLYNNNSGWYNPLSWIQINTPPGHTPLQRVPTADDDVVFSYARSGISFVGFATDNTNPDFNIGRSSANGPARCRSMHISNTTISIDNPSIVDGAPDVNIYTANGGFLKIDSGSNMSHGHIRLHGGNPAVTDLQLLHSNYGVLFSHANWSSITWDSAARMKIIGSKVGGYYFTGGAGANIFIDSTTISTNYFIIGDNSDATLLNSMVTNDPNNNYLKFLIGKNSNFVSLKDTVRSYSLLQFTTSGSQFNGNVEGMGYGPGDVNFLQQDPNNPLPNIINGNFSASELTTSLGISGDLKISGDFSGLADDMFNNPIPVYVNNQQAFIMGGLKNYGSKAYIENCVEPFCHFKLEFFGPGNSNISWYGGGFPIDTLILNKTNCAKLTCDNSLYVSGATRILGGQLVLNPNENIYYKFVIAGNVDIAEGAGLFLRRNAAGITANMAIAGTLIDLNASSDSLCAGLSNPYNGNLTFYSIVTVPVTLLDFNGRYANHSVALSWRAVREVNAKHFVVEKSADQLIFDPIAKIVAVNAPGVNTYQYTDQKLLHRTNYYRLKMEDVDGSFTYSKILAIAAPEKIFITVFPNPVAEQLRVMMMDTKAAIELTITDTKGIRIRHIRLRAGTTNALIDTADLPAGIYYISFLSDTTKYTRQFIRK